MDELEQKAEELRDKFFQKLDNDSDPDRFHPADIAKIKNGNDWLKRFLTHTDSDFNASLQMLWDTCEWRNSFGTNDLNESNVKFLDEGGMFIHNKDIDGKTLLILKSKKHVKGQKSMDELKKFTVYWFERCERTTKGDQISIVFDMADTGLSNMDMEYTKYLIGLFKSYYPDFLNYIIILEMPWILNAAFKIIKSWLPAKAVQKIKFVSKSNLKDLVPQDQMLVSWGGLDDYEFVFTPEERLPLNSDRQDENKKKVTFADGSPMVENFQGFGDVSLTKDGDSYSLSNSSLSIVPPDTITFVTEGSELTGHFLLKNLGDKVLSFKVKTTSPEKFRVRPSSGLLVSEASVSINVVLLPGYQLPAFTRDKFLIMYLPVTSADMTAVEISELWKQQGGKNVEQHRLKCALGAVAAGSSFRNGSAHGSMNVPDVDRHVAQIMSKVDQLNESHVKLHGDVKVLQKLQWFTIFLIFVLGVSIFYYIMTYGNLQDKHCYARDL